MAQSPSGIDLTELSEQVSPRDDLFRHVNARWIERTEVPPDRAVHGAFHALRDDAEVAVREICERAVDCDAGQATDERKVGDLYAAFMDADQVERRDAEPLTDDLADIRGVTSTAQLARLVGRLQRHGTRGVVAWYVDSDPDDPDGYVVKLGQGGLGLPDEAYYREDAYAGIRDEYVQHVSRLLALVHEPEPAGAARRVLELETALAAGHWTNVDSRDAIKTHNRHSRAQLSTLASGLHLDEWLGGLHAPDGAFDEVVVRQPEALEVAARLFQERDLADWRAWLVFHHVLASSTYLSSRFVDEAFAFFGNTLSGIPTLRERWKRGVAVVEASLGEGLGRLYVDEHFPPGHKQHMQRLVGWLVAAYREDIASLDWMSPETRDRALAKLGRFTPKVGYPDRWRDYATLIVERDDLLGSVRRATAFESDRELAKLGGHVDRDEWHMTPQTVNAYYNPGMNEIVFPAAILRPPFFDPEADDAVNFGGIGAVIGHEIGHGFDDQGSRYDGDGRLVDWWSEADRDNFDQRAAALIKQYDGFAPAGLDGQHVNGALTVGENIGDLGGVTIAHRAYAMSLEGRDAPELDGYTGAQRVFLGWSQCWRQVIRPEEEARRIATDPHSPAEFRANVVRNLTEFHQAFGVTDGDGMWLAEHERVRIW